MSMRLAPRVGVCFVVFWLQMCASVMGECLRGIIKREVL